MKVEFRAASIGNGVNYTTLANEGAPTLAEKISGFQPAMTLSPDEQPGFGSAGIAVYDNANQKWKVTFIIERVHASPDAAEAFKSAEAARIGAIGNLDLKITTGATVNYLPAAATVEFTPDPQSDQSSKIRYAFIGGQYTPNAP